MFFILFLFFRLKLGQSFLSVGFHIFYFILHFVVPLHTDFILIIHTKEKIASKYTVAGMG